MDGADNDALVYRSGPEFPRAHGVGVGRPIVEDGRPKDGYDLQSTTDDPKHVEAQRKEAVEEKEANRRDYLPPHTLKSKDASIVSRLLAQRDRDQQRITDLERRLDEPKPQYQPPPPQPQYQPQPTPQEQQAVLEEFRQIQVRIAEEEKSVQARYGDYYQSVKRLEPGNETPIPPNSYCNLMMNVANAVDVGYHLSRHPETIAKLWSLESSG